MNRTYLAADFGGGSGRVIAGSLRRSDAGMTLELREIHRFSNRQVRLGDYLHWDFPALFSEMIEGLRKAARQNLDVVSVGIDTWGVDFGLVDRLGMLAGNPVCYRDHHTDGLPEEFFKSCDPSLHYSETGTQVLSINTLFRLLAMKKEGDPKLQIAEHLLFMPDLFSYYLTGKAGNEYTIASTSELLDPLTHDWNFRLIDSLGLPRKIFCPIIMPGTSRGNILPHIADSTGLPESVEVVAVASHDTQSAMFACAGNYSSERSAFLSSGTWSLFGVELPEPILSEKARLAGFTNEGGVGGTTSFLQNITGLWILQQLIEEWRKEDLETDYRRLTEMAEASDYDGIVDVDDPAFQKPDSMAEAISRFCIRAGMTSPASQGDFVRCVCLSLASRYKRAVDQLNSILPYPLEKLRIIGGGSNNTLLNRLTAEATGLEVIPGPAEATAIGNILTQAVADGSIRSKNEITFISEL